MNIRTLIRSLGGGEITPELYGRFDLAKFQTGLASCRNFQILPHGPAANRAGFGYINEVKFSAKKTRIIEYSFNTDQTYILEFGDLYVRFHTGGATLLSAASLTISAITKANPAVVTYVGTDPANGDWFFLATIGGMTQLNGRYVKAANVNTVAKTFEITDLANVNINSISYPVYSGGGTASKVYEVATPYPEAELFSIGHEQNADVITLVHPLHPPMQLNRLGASNWTLTTITFLPTVTAPTGFGVVPSPVSGAVSYSYTVTAIATDGLEESLQTTTVAVVNDLTVVGNANTLSWAAVTGAVRYNCYKLNNGLFGYIGQTKALTFVDKNILADLTRSPPEPNAPFTGTDNYPSCVSYFEQRRVFGGSNNKPQNLWFTRSATESNMTFSIPTQADDSISLRIAARQVNKIRHIVPLSNLLILTAGGEWQAQSKNSDVITPNSISIVPQAYVGANFVRPVITSTAVLYVQAQGSRVRQLSFSWQSQKYNSEDASIMAPHLFDNNTMVDMSYSRAPTQTVWVVRNDGVLLGMTYVPEQQINAWHHHDTLNGSFESSACVAEGSEDVLYTVTRRTVNGRSVRYIERLHSRLFVLPQDAFFVDAGLTYSGAPTKLLSGLWHLENTSVAILGDGAVFPNQIVMGGQITLTQAVSTAQVGIPITAELKTLPLSFETQGLGAGRTKNIDKVYVRTNQSSGLFAGPDSNNLVQYKQRTIENYGLPPVLRSAELEINIQPLWQDDGFVALRQSDPLPLTVVSISLEVAIGG